MVLWKFTVREVKNRPGRATLTLLSIVISVAAVVAVTVSTTTTHQAYREMYESLAGRAALEIVAPGDGPFNADAIAPMLEKTPGVQAVVPVLQQVTNLYRGQPIQVVMMGIDPRRDEAVRDYDLQEGQFFLDNEGAMLEAGLAKALGISVGDEIAIATTKEGRQTFQVVGLLAPRGAANINKAGIVFLHYTEAQKYFAKPGQFNLVSLVLDPNADEAVVEAQVAAALPQGLHARTPAMRTEQSRDTLKDVEQGLNFAYALSIALAIIMIFNTFLMNVGERRRQLAILRAIGTTRGQIVRMLLGEGLFMGTLGTVLGSLIGLGGAMLLSKVMTQLYSPGTPPLSITAKPFIIAGILGPSMSVLGMFIPAVMAGLITPLEGMRPVVSQDSARLSWRFTLLSLGVFVLTGSLLAACIIGWLPVQLTTPFGVAYTAAFVLLIPLVLGPLTRLVAAVLRPLLRVEGHLAQRQVLRRRARTTLTIGVLYIAVSTAVSLGTTLVNNIQDVKIWYSQTLGCDFIVRSLARDRVVGKSAPMPESLGREMRALDGVTGVDSIRRLEATAAGQPVLLIVEEFSDPEHLPLYLKEGDPVEVRQRLTQGDVVIGTVLAQRNGINVGDTIAMDTKEGVKNLRVAGTITAYLGGGMVAAMQRDCAAKLFDFEGVDAFLVNVAPKAVAGVEAKLKTLCEQHSYMLHSFTELRHMIDGILDGVVGGLWGLMGLGFIVSAFGIANTLSINVLEQTRELALLRVVAMTRRQVRKTILAQATLIGVIGLAAGVVGGAIGSYVINLCSLPLLGRTVDFVLHPQLMAVCFGAGLLVVLAAAWLPAERAARLNLLIALQYE
jgi:putative ABC transport system permease protein